MKTLGRIALVLLLATVIASVVVYADGVSLPVNHSVSVTGVVKAPSEKVFAIITDVGNGAAWRPAVKSVRVLPPDSGRDQWIEDIGRGQTMKFLAVRTDAPTRREVLLADPGASYGGTWIYELTSGPGTGQTTLHITETGFINPPLYQFMMAHMFGPTRNLEVYLKDIQARAEKG